MNKSLFAALFLSLGSFSAGLKASDSHMAMYLLAGLDGKILTNQDATNYFNVASGSIGAQGYPGGVLRVGIQLMRLLSLEASANFGPERNNSVTYQNGVLGTTRQVTTRWGVTTYSLMPAVTWAGLGFVNSLGLRVGLANLSGHVDDQAYGTQGSYDSAAQAYDVGILFRSSQIYVQRISMGLELGYDHTLFSNITNKNGVGTYGSPHSPERNVSLLGHNGDNTVLDFSGVHIAVVLGLWSNAPVTESAE